MASSFLAKEGKHNISETGYVFIIGYECKTYSLRFIKWS
jgi:hypothetical protein